MPTLPLQDKIRAGAPARKAVMEVERFQTDNYSIRAAKGFNNVTVNYQVTWTKLTQAQAKQLGDFFDTTAGVDLIQWTPPYEASQQNFTVESYEINFLETTGLETQYTYIASATLRKEFDL